MAMDLQTLHTDGANFYKYLRGNPFMGSDPLGLYCLGDLGNDATETLGLLDPLPGPSDFIRSALSALVTEYSANLSWDAEWAGDWSTGDDWHSRTDNSWVTLAIGRGLFEAFDIDLPFTDDTLNPLDYVAREKDSRSPYKSVRTPLGRAKFSKTVTVNGKTAYKYVNPKGGRELIKFDEGAIIAKRQVVPSNPTQERLDANMSYWGKPHNPPDADWHHHWKTGEMQLVPRDLHRAVGAGHVGRAATWPAPR